MLPKSIGRRLWLGALLLWVAVILFPLSTRLTRLGGLGLFLGIWFGLIWLVWERRPIRLALLAVTAAGAVFLVLPGRQGNPVDGIRDDYVAGLKRYEGVTYYWGGESPRGIDCSGLVRRGLVDSLFVRGFRSVDPGLVRRAFSIWWRDTTAKAMGTPGNDFTIHLAETPSLNVLDHAALLPGDLAVTADGVHVMAYLGNKVWIEADPGLGRVIAVQVPVRGNLWFEEPMKIVRWHIFSR